MSKIKQHMSLKFNAKVSLSEKINEEFIRCKVWVQGVGKNRNMSYMSEENIRKNLSTLSYCPVVGHLIEADDGSIYMGGHDSELICDEKGLRFKDLTVPFGVVCKDSFAFENVDEFGETVKYLTADVILWVGRYPELKEAIYSEDFYFNQSMELSVEQYRPYIDDSNYTEILDWTYSALCLLGKADDINSEQHTEPCFINSHVEPYKFALNEDFIKTMNEMKKQISSCFENFNFPKEGGEVKKMNQEKINEILSEYNITLEDLDFEITDDMTEENFRVKLDECNHTQSKINTFVSTYRQKADALSNVCNSLIERDENGDVISSTYYWVCDFDDNYVYVRKSFYSDNDCEETDGRFTYTFDESTLTATLTSEFELMIVTWLTVSEKEKLDKSRNEFEILEKQFKKYKESHSTPNTEVKELKEFKENKLKEEFKTQVEEKLAEFSDLDTVSEFIELKKKALDYNTVEDLEKDCYIIRGKNTPVKFSKNTNKSIKVPISTHLNDVDEYGAFFNEYGDK